MSQIIITLGMFLVCLTGMVIFYNKRKKEKPDEIIYTQFTMPYLLDFVMKKVIEVTREDEVIKADSVEYRVRKANKERVNKALVQCVNAIKPARKIVIALIRDIIQVVLLTEEDCNKVKDFKSMEYLPHMDKFEVLYYVLEKEVGDDVINYLEEKYELTKLRGITTDAGVVKLKREFDASMLDMIFQEEVLNNKEVMDHFGYEEQLDIISRQLFALYKGYREIDTLNTAKIDGYNYGTSGSVRYEIEGNWNATYKSTNSVWVQINAMWVHFSFIDFGNSNNMRRCVRQQTSYGNLAPMTEKMPIKVTESPEGERIVGWGPPVAECWACFVRKFNLSIHTIKFLLDKPYANNYELPMRVVYYLAKSRRTLPVTGQQNTGKTTFMKALIELFDLMNIRVMEMSFELALREIYPWMNILTAKPTQHVSNSKVQDTFKKTDGALSLVGELAENEVVPNMMQFAIVATACTMFSSHHKDDHGLIYGLADSWIAVSNIDRDAAISSILDVIKLNIHMGFVNNNRVVEYISEIVKESELKPYPAISMPNDAVAAIYQQTVLDRENYTRTTDRIKFVSRYIVKYDEDTQSYVANDWFTDTMVKDIFTNLSPEDREGFVQLANECFLEARKKRKILDQEEAIRNGQSAHSILRREVGA